MMNSKARQERLDLLFGPDTTRRTGSPAWVLTPQDLKDIATLIDWHIDALDRQARAHPNPLNRHFDQLIKWKRRSFGLRRLATIM